MMIFRKFLRVGAVVSFGIAVGYASKEAALATVIFSSIAIGIRIWDTKHHEGGKSNDKK